MVTDFRGQAHPRYPFWNAATDVAPERLRGDLELLPKIAEAGLCDAGKDISMGGVLAPQPDASRNIRLRCYFES
jgi:uncharacterized protein